jgi:Spy/CpxP family protein refolding chaperone
MKVNAAICIAMAITISSSLATAVAQVEVPSLPETAFWNNTEAVKKFKLTEKQRQALDQVVRQANEEFNSKMQETLTPEQWKQIAAFPRQNRQVAAQMGFFGYMEQRTAQAKQVAKSLQIARDASLNYVMFMESTLTRAASQGARILSVNASQSADPCKEIFETMRSAAPDLNPELLKLSIEFKDKKWSGDSCPAAKADLSQERGGYAATVKATYPCAASPKGVDLVPGCEISASVSEYLF